MVIIKVEICSLQLVCIPLYCISLSLYLFFGCNERRRQQQLFTHTHTNVSFSLFHCFSYSSFSFLSTWCSGKQSAMKQSCKADNTHFRAASAAAATSVFFFLSNSFKKILKKLCWKEKGGRKQLKNCSFV